jgi:hypothetical protein
MTRGIVLISALYKKLAQITSKSRQEAAIIYVVNNSNCVQKKKEREAKITQAYFNSLDQSKQRKYYAWYSTSTKKKASTHSCYSPPFETKKNGR